MDVDGDDARAGKTGVGLRYVLAASLLLVLMGMALALYFSG
jgi:hypothetical protein